MELYQVLLGVMVRFWAVTFDDQTRCLADDIENALAKNSIEQQKRRSFDRLLLEYCLRLFN